MTPDEARRTAMSYAWGYEDASRESGNGVVTAKGGEISGDWAFGEAYAQGQDDYDAERRGNMISVQDAYRNWQDSGGKSVFKRGDLTLSDARRRALRESWPDLTRAPEAYTAWWTLRDEYQDEAWDALP
jgi:hypothetical protein